MGRASKKPVFDAASHTDNALYAYWAPVACGFSRIHHHTRRNHDEVSGFGGFLLRIGAVELRDGLRQERASITDFHGLINQRVHIVLEQRAASAKAEQYWSGVKIVAGIAGVGALPLPESPVSLDLAESFVPEPALLDESNLPPPPMAEVRPPA